MNDIRQTKIATIKPRQTEIIRGNNFTVLIISNYSKKLSSNEMCYVAKDMLEASIIKRGNKV